MVSFSACITQVEAEKNRLFFLPIPRLQPSTPSRPNQCAPRGACLPCPTWAGPLGLFSSGCKYEHHRRSTCGTASFKAQPLKQKFFNFLCTDSSCMLERGGKEQVDGALLLPTCCHFSRKAHDFTLFLNTLGLV